MSDSLSASQGQIADDPLADRGGLDLFRLLWGARFRIGLMMLVVGLAYTGVAALLYAFDTKRTTATQELVFTFDGAPKRQYPDGSRFSPQDMLAEPVIAMVHQELGLKDLLKPKQLAAALSLADTAGLQASLVRAAFTQKLTNGKLTQPEREQLEAEYRRAMERLAGLTYALQLDLEGLELPGGLADRILLAVPDAWSRYAQQVRGLSEYDLPIPSIIPADAAGSQLYHLAVLTEELNALDRALKAVQSLPGAASLRNDKGLGPWELGRQLTVLRRTYYEPLVDAVYARAGRAGLLQLQSNIEASMRVAEAAKARAEAAKTNFEFYAISGRNDSGLGGASAAGQDARGVQSPAPANMPMMVNLPDSLFTRMMELGTRNLDLEYRQKLNDEIVKTTGSQVDAECMLADEQYRLDKVKAAQNDPQMLQDESFLPRMIDVKRSLTEIATEARTFVDELSRRNLNAPSEFFRIEGPAQMARQGTFSVRTAVMGLFGVQCLAVLAGLLWNAISPARRMPPSQAEDSARRDTGTFRLPGVRVGSA